MILSRKWANDYVDLTDIDNKTFCDEMTLSGSKVELTHDLGAEIRRRRSAAANRHRRPKLKAHGHCAGGTGGCYGDQPQRP